MCKPKAKNWTLLGGEKVLLELARGDRRPRSSESSCGCPSKVGDCAVARSARNGETSTGRAGPQSAVQIAAGASPDRHASWDAGLVFTIRTDNAFTERPESVQSHLN